MYTSLFLATSLRTLPGRLIRRILVPVLAATTFCSGIGLAENLPSRLTGTWRITRVLPTGNTACWNAEQAGPLLGTTLTYRNDSMRWHGGAVPLSDITTRIVTAAEFSKENGTGERNGASFRQLGIRAAAVTEVDLQHEDMDITGATTEVPGDSVLLVAPNRIIVSACGVFFEATRSSASITSAALHR